mgnify:CR=1 FL=1
MPVRKLTSEQRLSRAIDIMEALYAAGDGGMTRTEICSRFDITGASLDEILEIVSSLADRESGARIICECRGERVALTGGRRARATVAPECRRGRRAQP